MQLARRALARYEPWLVGGTVRDLLMVRRVQDVDLVVSGDAAPAARELARAAGGPVFPLSERFGAWRVLAPDRSWQADLTPVREGGIEADLAARDFTINAMAVPLSAGEPLLDLHGGLADLEAKTVRVVSETSYRDDPLRVLRTARIACELGFEVDQRTKDLGAAHAPSIARSSPERIFYELRRLIASHDALRGIELVDELRLVRELLPELEALKGVEQNPYHHLDVWGHTLAVLGSLIEMERDPERLFGDIAGEVLDDLHRPLADDLDRLEGLRLAALVHDIGKPRTRRIREDGRVMFWGHDELGAGMVSALCRRLRTSTALSDFLAEITRQHLRLGFLVHEEPLNRRNVYRYMRACEPIELEVTVLSVADRLATRGERTRTEALEAHLALARRLAAEALAWRAGEASRPPLTGDDLMRELDLEPGPDVGALLELLSEASFAGEISSREEALEFARRQREHSTG